jgi:molecular chaperone Hsp33
MIGDRLLICEGDGLLFYACVAPGLMADAAERHKLASGSAAALGQAMCGALLLSAHSQTRVDVQLECPGPLRGLLADADASGAARGLVRVPDLPASFQGARFDPRTLLATGNDELAGRLSIVRKDPELRRTIFPFAGADLGAALTLALRSETMRGGEMALELIAPGTPAGVLIAPLGDEEEAIEAVRERGKPLRQGGLFQALEGLRDLEELPGRLGLPEVEYAGEVTPRFECRCSRERVTAALSTLDPAELRDMAERDHGAVCSCDFCGESYRISAAELLSFAAGPA